MCTQTFTIQNEDLVFRGMIGEGHFGIVDKMVYTKNDTQMAVKVDVYHMTSSCDLYLFLAENSTEGSPSFW